MFGLDDYNIPVGLQGYLLLFDFFRSANQQSAVNISQMILKYASIFFCCIKQPRYITTKRGNQNLYYSTEITETSHTINCYHLFSVY